MQISDNYNSVMMLLEFVHIKIFVVFLNSLATKGREELPADSYLVYFVKNCYNRC